MIRLLGIVAVCLALASCAGAPGRLSPASDAGLASRGWEEASTLGAYTPTGAHVSKALICKNTRCGGPGFVVAATKPMSASNTQSFQAMMANRRLTDARLLQAFQLLSEGSPKLAEIDGHLVGVRKHANSMVLNFTFSKTIPAMGYVSGLARAHVTATEMSVVVAAGPTAASARQRMGLIRN